MLDHACSKLATAQFGDKPIAFLQPQSEGLLFIGNLDFGFTEEALLTLSEQFGILNLPMLSSRHP